MSTYRLSSQPLFTLATQEARAKRREVLAKAAQTRRTNYARFVKKTPVASKQ